MLVWLLARARKPLLYAGMGLALVPLSYLPGLVGTESWAAYRTQVTIGSLIALYVAFGAVGLWLVARDWLRRRLDTGALRRTDGVALAAFVAFVALSVGGAAWNVTTLMVAPQISELRLLRNQVTALPAGISRVAFVETDWYGGPTGQVLYDEFGLPSTAQRGVVRPWAPESMVDLVLREEGRLGPTGPPTVDFLPPTTTSYPRDEPVIDLRAELRNLR
jgi:hypothetical protein